MLVSKQGIGNLKAYRLKNVLNVVPQNRGDREYDSTLAVAPNIIGAIVFALA